MSKKIAEEMTEEEIQSAVDDFVLRHGEDHHQWPWKDRKLPNGLTVKEVTPERLAIASSRNKDRITAAMKEVSEEMKEPTEAEKEDIRYRNKMRKEMIVENSSSERVFTNVVEGHPDLDPDLNADHPVAGRAKAERNLQEEKESEKKTRLAELRKKKEENMYSVSESAARSMLSDMGMPNADELVALSIPVKLNSLPSIMDQLTEPKESASKRLRDRILNALQEGKKIVLQTVDSSEKAKRTRKKPAQEEAKESPKRRRQAKISSENGSEPSKKEVKAPRAKSVKKEKGQMSLVEAALKVLSSRKKSMSAKDLVEEVQNKGYWKSGEGKTPHQTLAAAFYTEINKKGKESRVARGEPGTFILSK